MRQLFQAAAQSFYIANKTNNYYPILFEKQERIKSLIRAITTKVFKKSVILFIKPAIHNIVTYKIENMRIPVLLNRFYLLIQYLNRPLISSTEQLLTCLSL